MFACASAESVATKAAQESNQLLVVTSDAAQECVPCWTLAARRSRSRLGGIVVDPGRPHRAGAQVDYSGRRIEEPRICVPLVGCCSESPIGFGEPSNGRNGLSARDSHPNARIIRLA